MLFRATTCSIRSNLARSGSASKFTSLSHTTIRVDFTAKYLALMARTKRLSHSNKGVLNFSTNGMCQS